MCGFIVAKDSKENLIQALESIEYRGLPGFNGYHSMIIDSINKRIT